jgi:hypothetical protein
MDLLEFSKELQEAAGFRPEPFSPKLQPLISVAESGDEANGHRPSESKDEAGLWTAEFRDEADLNTSEFRGEASHQTSESRDEASPWASESRDEAGHRTSGSRDVADQ